MKAHGIGGEGWNGCGGLAALAAVLVALLPPEAGAQWDDPDTFTVGNSVGVGTLAPARQIHVQGNNAVFRMDRDVDGVVFLMVRTAAGNFNDILKTWVVGANAAGHDNGVFYINDLHTDVAGAGTRRFTIFNNGRIGNVSAPQAGLHIKNPVDGDILRLQRREDGVPIAFSVESDGDIRAMGADLELQNTTWIGGFDLRYYSTVLRNTTEPTEPSFLALNAETAVLCSSGDHGLLQILDQDNYQTNYVFNNTSLEILNAGDYWLKAIRQGNAQELVLATTGEEVQFVADSNGNTDQTWAFSWYNDGTGNTHKRMGLTDEGHLYLDGALQQLYNFDLAEAFWKSEPEIEAGDVVRVDPAAPNAVVLARQANDPAVVGVISTDPGIVMGGGAFCTNKLASVWGEEVAALFAKERGQIEAALMATDRHLQACAAQLASLENAATIAAKAREKPEDVARAEAEYASEQQQLADALEDSALRAFCESHLARLSLAGRVPVKVDATYGAIRAGDLLVASDTAGRAMRAEDPAPGTVIGKALEPCAAGQGLIMMLVMNR